MTSKERVLAAFARRGPDRVPINYMANYGIDARLKQHFGLAADDAEGLRRALGVDFRPAGGCSYKGPTLHPPVPNRDARVDGLWGVRTRWVEHASGGYWDYCDFPLQDAGVEAIERWPFPSPDDFDCSDRLSAVIKLNTMGTILPCQVFGHTMARQGRGAMVNFASMNSYRACSRNLAYGVAKAGVVNLTQWLAAYLAPAGIRVNAVAPGFFVNERSRKILMTEDGGLTARGQNVMAHTPMKRFGEAQELVGCVCWLLDDERASFVTGVTVPVDGGFLSSAGI